MEALIKNTEISISIRNRNILVAELENVIWQVNGVPFTMSKNSCFLALKRNDCGCEYKYKEAKDVPSSSVICKHGNQIIRYTDEELLN